MLFLLFFLFFFLMIRPPPRSTLFPTRRSSDLIASASRRKICFVGCGASNAGRYHAKTNFWRSRRSEEHTSELQSHVNLVCRLLLEKKKKKKTMKENQNTILLSTSTND